MTLGGVVLFLHIGVAIAAFVVAGILHTALYTVARVRDVREMRSWAAVVHRLDPLFPILALILLVLGAWLIHLSGGEFRWSDGWVITAVSTLVVLEALGGIVIAPRSKRLVQAVKEARDGGVPDDLRSLVLDTAFWDVAHVATVGFAGIVFLMAVKPAGAWSPAIVVVAAALGWVASRWQLRALTASATVVVPAEIAGPDSA